jgi:hypothetical protein
VMQARAYKGETKNEAHKSHSMLLRVWESVKEWTPTLPSELPFWELEFRWTAKSSENDCRGQNLGIETFLISLESS